MQRFPPAVHAIADDYLLRLKGQLGPLPATEQSDFLREIESHVYEAYWEEPGEDPLAKILAVLRKLGEPSEVVAERLPDSMLRTGTDRYMPFRVVAGIAIAIFGVPIGIGGAAVMLGAMASLVGLLLSYYALVAAMALTGSLFLALGLIHTTTPGLWDRLVYAGVIHVDGAFGALADQISAGAQSAILFLAAGILLGLSFLLFTVGRRALRGLNILASVLLDWGRRAARSCREYFRADRDRHSRGGHSRGGFAFRKGVST